MADKNPQVSRSPVELSSVLAEELEHMNGTVPDGDGLEEVFTALHDANLAALCFSGGGIRSATFGLGIVQALAKFGLLGRFDYLSTVSGGGYLGSWLSAWAYRAAREDHDGDTNIPQDLGISRVQDRINCRDEDENGSSKLHKDQSPNPEAPELRHLREYSNYMSPKAGLLSADTWALGAIYIRNLFLNLTIFIPLMAAVLILPRFLFQFLKPPPWPELASIVFLSTQLTGIALATGAVAITFVILSLPSRNERKKSKNKARPSNTETLEKPFLQSDAGVLIAGVLPLVTSAFLAAMLWAWNYRLDDAIVQQRLGGDLSIFFFLAVAAIAYAFGTLAYFLLNGTKGFHFWGSVATLISSLAGGVLLWLVSQKILDDGRMAWLGSWVPGFEWQLYLCFAVPLFLIIVLAAATLFIGLSSKIMTDEDREWLARYGGWVMFVAAVWVLVNAIVLIAPSLVSLLFRNLDPARDLWTAVAPTVVSIVGVVSGVVSLIGGFSGESKVRDEPVKSRTSRFLAFAPQIASVVFLGFILVGLASLATPLIYWLDFSGDSWSHIHVLNEANAWELAIVFGALALAGFIMACFVNVNKFSLHGAYRDRLVRAYLGASNRRREQTTFTGFDDSDNLELHQLAGQRPLHVINATVNLVGGDNLAWQNRKAASFTMSPLHCGSWAVGGYRASKDYCYSRSSDRALRLGTAMAISGAAANPNMGYFSSPVVTFLMSLFNIRLGWWLGNTGAPGSSWDWLSRQFFYQKIGPSIAVLPLINETFGRTDEHKRFLMVTDGGHFENLALYEMVLRRCRLIVLSDGAADADFKFGEIANAIQKCKVDLGVDIQFLGSLNIRARGTEEGTEVKRSRFAIAQITYPEKKDGEHRIGWLLYTRPTYYGKKEPRDVQYYADANDRFPHQSTGDQMYDEKQFEAYRGLGYLTMKEIRGIFDATSKGDPEDQVDDELEQLFATETDMRKVLFGFFNLPDPDLFKTRAEKGTIID